MPLQIVKNDITKMNVDAIVNAANNTLLGGGGVDGAIHQAAGQELLKECITLHGCETGQAKYTKGYNLPCKYVIHTVGPIWIDGNHNEKEYLTNCYNNCLKLARQLGCKSLAFPLISTGAYGYPVEKALKVAYDTIINFLIESEMEVYLVIYNKNTIVINKNLYNQLSMYIQLNLQVPALPLESESPFNKRKTRIYNDRLSRSVDCANFFGFLDTVSIEQQEEASLADKTFDVADESFKEMLFRIIDEKGMTDSECYNKAHINRKLFSKIRCIKDYKPSKSTVILLALSLELPLEQATELLMKAGYALSDADLFDVIIKFCFKNHYYDIFEINKVLFANDLRTLGS